MSNAYLMVETKTVVLEETEFEYEQTTVLIALLEVLGNQGPKAAQNDRGCIEGTFKQLRNVDFGFLEKNQLVPSENLSSNRVKDI